MKPVAVLLIAIAWPLCVSAGDAQTSKLPVNPFFAYKNSMETAGPASIDEQVSIIADIGFDGFDNRDLDDIEAALQALERRQLKLFTAYFTVKIDEGETPYNPRLPEVLPLLQKHGTILWCNTNSKQFKPSDPAGDARAVPIFQQLADQCAPYGVRVAPYPHINLWVETPEDTLRLVHQVNRPNFGTSFNLFHWRALGAKQRPIEEVARELAPHMFVMSINGNDGTTAVEGISPLQMAQIDEYWYVLKAFRDAGYAGPVGLQCYRVPGDPRQHLRQSMDVWKQLIQRF